MTTFEWIVVSLLAINTIATVAQPSSGQIGQLILRLAEIKRLLDR